MFPPPIRPQTTRMAFALAVAVVMFGVSVSAVSASDHPPRALASTKFGGVITMSGRIDSTLRLNVSSAAAITTALGVPAVQMTGVTVPSIPQYLGLGYECLGSQLSQCSTVYYISQETNRLEAFSTTSRAYRLTNGVRVGMSGGEASRLAHKRDLGGCTQGISLHTPSVETYLATKGGKMKEEPGALVISGGQVISITLEDRHYGVGALFC
jgi:hypothetical protein